MRRLGIIGALLSSILAIVGPTPALAQEATPAAPDGTVTFTLVEHALHVTIIDLGESGPSAGDLTVWGPDPLFDEANVEDTGALTQGSCLMLNADGDNHCYETIVFPDGSTLAIQGVQLGSGGPSVTTIAGGSGQYQGATGTLTVTASEDRFLWTKVFVIAFGA